MLDLIFLIKFVHLAAAAAMLGTWFAIALLMRLADLSHNPSVVAVASRFAVQIEKTVMIAAIALQPVSGLALAGAIGTELLGELWLDASLPLFVAIVAAWFMALRYEVRIRELSRQAALDNVPLPAGYDRLFRIYSMFTWPGLALTLALFLLMTWQPRWS